MKLHEIWAKARGIILPEKKTPRLNLFGHCYNAMLAEKNNLSPLEVDRMLLFTAIAQVRGDVKNYTDYIKQMGAFCNECIMNPDSPWAKGIDGIRIGHFGVRVDLLIASFTSCGKDYMDKVRNDMPVPIDQKMRKRATAFNFEIERLELRQEIQQLRADKRSP